MKPSETFKRRIFWVELLKTHLTRDKETQLDAAFLYGVKDFVNLTQFIVFYRFIK